MFLFYIVAKVKCRRKPSCICPNVVPQQSQNSPVPYSPLQVCVYQHFTLSIIQYPFHYLCSTSLFTFVFLSFRKALAFATWPVSRTGQQHQPSDRNPLSLRTVSPKRHSFQPLSWWGRRNWEAFPDSGSRCRCVSADKITSRSCRNHALFRPSAIVYAPCQTSENRLHSGAIYEPARHGSISIRCLEGRR